MKKAVRPFLSSIYLVIIPFVFLSGCAEDYLVFTTGTKFGLDISQQPDQPPNLVLGYKRLELASIPAIKKNATTSEDTYSVLGNFCVKADPQLLGPFNQDSLQIRSVFSTGMAAREIADNPAMQLFFARHVLGIGLREPDAEPKGRTNKNCF